ncbi:MAG: hypothetical protein HYX72_00145 [Acidobacteria bacterium]|nr:hypothetical protein [Acidobacteriota bacterium]
MNRTLVWVIIATIICAVVSASAAQEQTAIFPVGDIRAGMKGVAYSVFEGSEPESVPLEVVGVLKNAWGPRQHIILVRIGGRFAKTGVAAGMSGSPVYIDGKWVGAISLRIGAFPTDPIAGVTPAELMMEITDADTQPASGIASNLPRPSSPRAEEASTTAIGAKHDTVADQLMAAVSNLLPASVQLPQSAASYMTPIETPLVFSGFSSSVLEFFSPVFQRMNVVAMQGGADSDSSSMASAEELKTALQPGSAVSGLLATGDISLAGTGTVTYNDGRRVLAFGHPFFGLGPVEMPMAKAEIITTLGSTFAPFKIANSGQIVGALTQDRHSGIMGVLGKQARMIPVSVSVRSGQKSSTYNFQVFQSPQWTPVIMLVTLFNTISQSNLVATPTSFRVKGAVHIAGYPDLQLNALSATPPESQLPPGFVVANWLGQRFNTIFSNRIEKPEISSVDLDIELLSEMRSATIENVWSTASEVHPGDEVSVKIALRPYRGERIIKDALIKVPANTPKGMLRILFSDAEVASQQSQERLALQQNRSTALRDIIRNLNDDRSNQEVHVTILQPLPSALYNDKLLPSIPSTIANVLDSGRAANRLTPISETALGQFSIPMDMVVIGSQSVNLTVN